MEKTVVSSDDFYQAVNRIWAFNFSAAEKYFNPDNAESPMHCYYYGETLALRALLTEDPDETKEAIKRLEAAEKLLSKTQKSSGILDVFRKISLSDNRKQEDKLTTETRLLHAALLAELNALLGCLFIRRGYYVKGGLYIRKSWKSFEYLAKKTGILHEDNAVNNTDAPITDEIKSLIAHRNSILYFGTGAFYYFVSLVPSSFAWLVEALGFKANRQFGLGLLTKCYEMQGARAMIALVLVLWIQIFFFEDKVKSTEVLDLALQRYPEGTPYYYLGGYFARKQRDIKRAIGYFERVNELTTEVRRFQITSYYEIGWCHWLGADWREAAHWFEKFLAEHKSPSFKAYCGYQLGVAYDMLGEKDKAARAFAPVPSWVRKHYTWDQFAARKAKEYLKNDGITQYERLIVHAQIVAKIRPEEALGLLKQARNTGESNEEVKAVYYYIKGIAEKSLQKFGKAKKSFERGISLEPLAKKEIYAIPHCLTEYGEILLDEGRIDEAKKMFTKARKGFSNYDFDKPLIRKLEKNLDLIKQQQKTEKREAKKNKTATDSVQENKPSAVRRVKSYSGTVLHASDSEAELLKKVDVDDIDDVKY